MDIHQTISQNNGQQNGRIIYWIELIFLICFILYVWKFVSLNKVFVYYMLLIPNQYHLSIFIMISGRFQRYYTIVGFQEICIQGIEIKLIINYFGISQNLTPCIYINIER